MVDIVGCASLMVSAFRCLAGEAEYIEEVVLAGALPELARLLKVMLAVASR